MTKQRILGISIIILILAKTFLKKYMDFSMTSWANIIYFLLLIILGALLFRNFKPRSTYFWLLLLVYFAVVALIAFYNIF